MKQRKSSSVKPFEGTLLVYGFLYQNTQIFFYCLNIVNGKFGKLIQEDLNEDEEEPCTPEEIETMSMGKTLKKKMTRELGGYSFSC